KQSSGLVSSASTEKALPPFDSISSTTNWLSAAVLPIIIGIAPSSAKLKLIPFPIPFAAPVTRTTLSFNPKFMIKLYKRQLVVFEFLNHRLQVQLHHLLSNKWEG